MCVFLPFDVDRLLCDLCIFSTALALPHPPTGFYLCSSVIASRLNFLKHNRCIALLPIYIIFITFFPLRWTDDKTYLRTLTSLNTVITFSHRLVITSAINLNIFKHEFLAEKKTLSDFNIFFFDLKNYFRYLEVLSNETTKL